MMEKHIYDDVDTERWRTDDNDADDHYFHDDAFDLAVVDDAVVDDIDENIFASQ